VRTEKPQVVWKIDNNNEAERANSKFLKKKG